MKTGGTGPGTYALMILAALQRKSLDNVYLGTVSPETKAKRRAKGKVAKAQRKANHRGK